MDNIENARSSGLRRWIAEISKCSNHPIGWCSEPERGAFFGVYSWVFQVADCFDRADEGLSKFTISGQKTHGNQAFRHLEGKMSGI